MSISISKILNKNNSNKYRFFYKEHNTFRYGSKQRKLLKKQLLLPIPKTLCQYGISDHHVIPKSLQFHDIFQVVSFDIHHEQNIVRMFTNKQVMLEIKQYHTIPTYFLRYGGIDSEHTLFHYCGHRQYNKYVQNELNKLLHMTNENQYVQFYLLFSYLKNNCHQGRNHDKIPWNK